MADSQSLVGRIIYDEDLRNAITANIPEATFKNNQLVNNSKDFLSVNFCFLNHEITPNENGVVESMTISVSSEVDRLPPELPHQTNNI